MAEAQSGQIVRKKKKLGKGIVVSLNAGEPQPLKAEKSTKQTKRSKSSGLTVPQLLTQLESKIASLGNTIAMKKEQLAQKQALYKQISTLARR